MKLYEYNYQLYNHIMYIVIYKLNHNLKNTQKKVMISNNTLLFND